jgi:ribose 5-phosphate isomerase B
MMSQDTAIKIVDTWLSAEFEGGRHEKRIEQIESDESSRV